MSSNMIKRLACRINSSSPSSMNTVSSHHLNQRDNWSDLQQKALRALAIQKDNSSPIYTLEIHNLIILKD